jgi:hypothetical protein
MRDKTFYIIFAITTTLAVAGIITSSLVIFYHIGFLVSAVILWVNIAALTVRYESYLIYKFVIGNY